MDNIKEKLGGAFNYAVGTGAAVGGLAVDGCRAAAGAANGVIRRGMGVVSPPPPPPPKDNDFFGAFKNIGGADKYAVGAANAAGGFVAGLMRRGSELFTPPPPPKDNGYLVIAADALKNLGGGINDYIQNMEPKTKRKCILACTCVVAAGACICGATLMLPLVGFGTNGVASASLASWIHATIGNVMTGSLFASLQSAGVLGFGASTKGLIGICGAAPFLALFRLNPPAEPKLIDMFDILQEQGIYGFTT